jgi:hypothetical protein
VFQRYLLLFDPILVIETQDTGSLSQLDRRAINGIQRGLDDMDAFLHQVVLFRGEGWRFGTDGRRRCRRRRRRRRLYLRVHGRGGGSGGGSEEVLGRGHVVELSQIPQLFRAKNLQLAHLGLHLGFVGTDLRPGEGLGLGLGLGFRVRVRVRVYG